MTTTSPFAEKMSFGLIGVETSMVMKLNSTDGRRREVTFHRVEDGLCYSDMEHNDCVTDGNKPLAKRSRGMLRVEFRLRWVSYEPADLVNAIPFVLLLCQTS